MADPWAPGLPKHPWQDLLHQDSAEECLPTCWELWEAKEHPSNMVPLESKVWIDWWHVPPETLTELEELKQEEERHNLPDNVQGLLIAFNPIPPEVVHFLRCHNYENANRSTSARHQNWNAAWSMQGRRCHSWSSHGHDRQSASTLRLVGMYAGIRVIMCLLVRFNIQQANL